MENPRHLSHQERAYIIQKIGKIDVYNEEYGEIDKATETKLIESIISKIQAPQDHHL